MNFISILRLIVFCSGIAFTYYFYKIKLYYLSVSVLIVFGILLVLLVIKYNKLKTNKNYAEILSDINDKSIKRMLGEWNAFSDSGKDFVEEGHSYSYDLDIFGYNSLFQWINTAKTYFGRKKLYRILTETPDDIKEIYRRQDSVKELAKNISWRQRFEAEAVDKCKGIGNIKSLFEWVKKRDELYSKAWLIVISKMFPICTIISLIVSFINENITFRLPLLLIILQITMLIPGNYYRNKILNTVYENKKNILLYANMIKMLEKKEFKTDKLNNLKKSFKNTKGLCASEQINKLVKISNAISQRNNMMYIILNMFLLWDYRCVIALEKWKMESGNCLEKWFEVIGEVEALSSLALIKYDHPEWTFPEITDKELYFNAKDIGHPLIKENCVRNDLNIKQSSDIFLITGSNMSGKSTLLRTAGINLVLAFSGAPVCAKSFRCSLMNMYTCMRVNDDIEKRISSFYAEILRIKKLVEAVKKGEKVFFLLDEIFKGTNSIDRHTGAKILITKLSQNQSIGLVSTHDIELSTIEEESKGKVVNYHFEEYYEDNNIKFDYKLKRGVSTTRNALYLLKMAGIE